MTSAPADDPTPEASDEAGSSVRRRVLTALPIVLVAAIIAFVVVTIGTDEDAAAPTLDAIDLQAQGPVFASLDELIAASDVIVEGGIVAVDDGRAVTDPSDPAAGFTTALFQLDVIESFRGGDVDSLIVEQEAALLDGTPITVNGLAPNQVGDTGFWFLVRGDDETFPYVALVNEQGRILFDRLGEIDPATGLSMTSAELRARLRS